MSIFKRHVYKRWRSRDIRIFLERLELYLRSGLTMDSALDLCKSGISKAHRQTVEALIHHVESGSLLSSGFVRYMRMSHTTSGLIAHGETTGDLERAIRLVRTSMEKQEELVRKCISAMLYPCVIGIFSVAFIIGLMRGVLPQIVPMLEGLHAELPLISRIMIICSNALVEWGIYGLGILVILLLVFIIFYKKVSWFKYLIQSIISVTPLFGGLLNNYTVVIFLRSMGSLLESGFSLPKSFNDSVSTLTFLPVRKSLSVRAASLSRGSTLEKVLEQCRIPGYVVALVSAGERSGTLGESILKAADILEKDIEYILKKATTLIEPLMMICMGALVGAIALSIIMPIYDLSKVLQK